MAGLASLGATSPLCALFEAMLSCSCEARTGAVLGRHAAHPPAEHLGLVIAGGSGFSVLCLLRLLLPKPPAAEAATGEPGWTRHLSTFATGAHCVSSANVLRPGKREKV